MIPPAVPASTKISVRLKREHVSAQGRVNMISWYCAGCQAMHSAKQMAGSLEEYAALEEMEAKGDLGNEVAEAERRAKEEAGKPARTLAQVLVEQKKAVEDEDFKVCPPRLAFDLRRLGDLRQL